MFGSRPNYLALTSQGAAHCRRDSLSRFGRSLPTPACRHTTASFWPDAAKHQSGSSSSRRSAGIGQPIPSGNGSTQRNSPYEDDCCVYCFPATQPTPLRAELASLFNAGLKDSWDLGGTNGHLRTCELFSVIYSATSPPVGVPHAHDAWLGALSAYSLILPNFSASSSSKIYELAGLLEVLLAPGHARRRAVVAADPAVGQRMLAAVLALSWLRFSHGIAFSLA